MIHASAEFDHPAAAVFDAIADISEHAQWQRGVESVEILSGDGHSVGTRFAVRVGEAGIDLEFEGAVVEATRPTHLRHALTGKEASLDVQIEIVDLGARARLVYRADVEIRSFALKMLRKVIESKLEDKAESDMKSLARHLDTRAERR